MFSAAFSMAAKYGSPGLKLLTSPKLRKCKAFCGAKWMACSTAWRASVNRPRCFNAMPRSLYAPANFGSSAIARR